MFYIASALSHKENNMNCLYGKKVYFLIFYCRPQSVCAWRSMLQIITVHIQHRNTDHSPKQPNKYSCFKYIYFYT